MINKDSSEALRLAYRFWIELGRPARFHNRKTLQAWTTHMDELWQSSGLDYEDFRWFIIWALRPDDPDGARLGNDYTARNLRIARDPMSSLVKQFEITFEIFLGKAEKVVTLLKAKREQEGEQEEAEPEAEGTPGSSARRADRSDACGPLEGESRDEWIQREFADLHCRVCRFVDDDPEDERLAWCQDCAEEVLMYAVDDMEMFLEVPSESCLTKEWD